MERKYQLSFRMPIDLYNALAQQARDERRSVGAQLVHMALVGREQNIMQPDEAPHRPIGTDARRVGLFIEEADYLALTDNVPSRKLNSFVLCLLEAQLGTVSA